jgi:hypothetical protein
MASNLQTLAMNLFSDLVSFTQLFFSHGFHIAMVVSRIVCRCGGRNGIDQRGAHSRQ